MFELSAARAILPETINRQTNLPFFVDYQVFSFCHSLSPERWKLPRIMNRPQSWIKSVWESHMKVSHGVMYSCQSIQQTHTFCPQQWPPPHTPQLGTGLVQWARFVLRLKHLLLQVHMSPVGRNLVITIPGFHFGSKTPMEEHVVENLDLQHHWRKGNAVSCCFAFEEWCSMFRGYKRRQRNSPKKAGLKENLLQIWMVH